MYMPGRTDKLLDRIGWRVVAALQQNARITFNALGRLVGLSAPAVAERVKRLEEAGIITGYRAELGMDKLGRPVIALIRISAPEQNCVPLSKLVQDLPFVLESYRVTGADRLIVKVAVPSIAELDGILRELSIYGTATASVVLSSRVGFVQARE
jgi:Lrp/AsnC family leucine-responsive transcriptional regulator